MCPFSRPGSPSQYARIIVPGYAPKIVPGLRPFPFLARIFRPFFLPGLHTGITQEINPDLRLPPHAPDTPELMPELMPEFLPEYLQSTVHRVLVLLTRVLTEWSTRLECIMARETRVLLIFPHINPGYRHIRHTRTSTSTHELQLQVRHLTRTSHTNFNFKYVIAHVRTHELQLQHTNFNFKYVTAHVRHTCIRHHYRAHTHTH